MKKAAKILFAIVYLQFMIGFTVVTHYCCGEIAWQTVLPLVTLNDCGCGDDEPCSCCRYEYKTFSINDDQSVQIAPDGKTVLPSIILCISSEENLRFEKISQFEIPIYEFPPGHAPTYITNRTLLI